MATKWTEKKVDKSQLNGGEEYNLDSDVAIEELNSIVNNSLYASNISENVANQLAGLGANDKVEFKGSNPNLLINGDFRVNQRDLTEYESSTGYTVDRWRNSGCWAYVNSDKSVTLTHFGGWNYYYQNFEDFDKFKGKTVTLSVKIKSISYTEGTAEPRVAINDGVNTTLSELIPNGASGVFSVTKTISENATALFARPIQNNMSVLVGDLTVTIEWAKLEIGSVATPFSPRPRAEELLMCQRYYQVIKVVGGTGTVGNLGVPRNATTLRFYINLLTTMRTIPTTNVGKGGVTSSNVTILNLNTGTITPIDTNSLTLQSETTNQVALNYTTTGLTLGHIYNLTDTNGLMRLEFDAELY